MKKTIARLEPYRVKRGPFASDTSFGRNGKFVLPAKLIGETINITPMSVVISDATDWDSSILGATAWEHVSASWSHRCPTWPEMCRVKDLFFDEHEVVLQFLPSKKDYVNYHPYCLHLWKPIGVEFQVPPSLAVGPLSEVTR